MPVDVPDPRNRIFIIKLPTYTFVKWISELIVNKGFAVCQDKLKHEQETLKLTSILSIDLSREKAYFFCHIFNRFWFLWYINFLKITIFLQNLGE
jgi:hypothetical protein